MIVHAFPVKMWTVAVTSELSKLGRCHIRKSYHYIGIPVYSRIFRKICGKLASQKCGKICGILPKYAAYMRIILFWFYNRISSKRIGNVGLRANLLTIVCNYTLIVNIWQSIDSKLASCFVVCGDRSEFRAGQ